MTDTAITGYRALNPDAISRKDYLNSLLAEAGRAGLVSEAETDRIKNDLLNALAEVIGYYTKGDSSSIKAETARKLSLSLTYNIDTYLISLNDNEKALETAKERRMGELYGKGYLINSKLYEEAKVLFGKVRFTRLKDGGDNYNKTLDKYFYNYLLNYSPKFSAQNKIYLSLGKYGLDGAYHIDEAVTALKKLLEINRGRVSDVIITDTQTDT